MSVRCGSDILLAGCRAVSAENGWIEARKASSAKGTCHIRLFPLVTSATLTKRTIIMLVSRDQTLLAVTVAVMAIGLFMLLWASGRAIRSAEASVAVST